MKKQQTFLKNLMVLLALILTLSVVPACSNDDDEPDFGEGVEEFQGINPDVLPGRWLLVSATDENGKVTGINREFTILPFKAKQTSSNIVKGDELEVWAEAYEDFTSVNTVEGESLSSGVLGFFKKKSDNVSRSLIYEMTLSLEDNDCEGTIIAVMAKLSYKDGIVIGEASAYGHSRYDISSIGNPMACSIIMKKL